MTYTISIANEKGGVAKTTTVTSLGAALVECGFKVLLMDLDPQSNLSMALGVECTSKKNTSTQVLLEEQDMHSAIQETGVPHLDLIAASPQIGLAERFMPLRPEYEWVLTRALQQKPLDYDFLLMDCPPFLGAVTSNAVLASNLLIMPTQAEYFSINALRDMLTLIRHLRAQDADNQTLFTYRLLLTMVDRRNRIHRTLSEQLRQTFGSGVLNTVIEVDTKLRESPIAGLPILYHAPHSRAAMQYRALGQEIITYVKETTAQQA